MSLDYVENRIREALRLNNGNESQTKRQVHAWLYEDHKFLLELTRPHLNGIIAYAVARMRSKAERMAVGLTEEEADALADDVPSPVASAAAAKKKQETFGESMLRSIASDKAAKFGYESSALPIRKKGASQKHVDTIHLLAAASKNKNKADET